MARPSKYAPELRERAVRMVFEHAHDHASQWATIRSVAEKLGCTVEALRRWVRQAERDAGQRPGLTTDERQRLKQLEREDLELKRANEILRKASAFFARAERPPTEVMVTFIDQHCATYGVEPIGQVLPIAPSTYFRCKAEQRDPTRRSARARRDDEVRVIIRRIWTEHSRSIDRAKCADGWGATAASIPAHRAAAAYSDQYLV